MKLMVIMLDDQFCARGSVIVHNIPEDLHKHPTDPFADLEGRLREAAGAAAVRAHDKSVEAAAIPS